MEMYLSQDDVKSFVETQLSVWPLAKSNYDALAHVERRVVDVGDLRCGIQWNPARIRSTGAVVDRDTILKRECFLCRSNRPAEQCVLNIHSGWEMLVNPYPIFPIHLTIVSESHVPQSDVPDDIVAISEKLPGMAVFFNGAKAGASAPDHMHLQAVLKDELPLLRLVEKIHKSECSDLKTSMQFGINLPFLFFSGIVADDKDALQVMKSSFIIGGDDGSGKLRDAELKNVFFWIDDNALLRFVVVPRFAHRPACYYAEGDSQRIISPGCVDMAGLIITPLEKDFKQLSSDEITKIYQEVAIPLDNV